MIETGGLTCLRRHHHMVPSLVTTVLTHAVTVAAAAAAATADKPFYQFSSARFYLSGGEPPEAFRAPLPALNFSVAQLLSPPATTEPAARSVWVLTTEGSLLSVGADGSAVAVRMPQQLLAAATLAVGSGTARAGVVIVAGPAVHWLNCSAGPTCSVIATGSLPRSGNASKATCVSVDERDTVFLGTADGLYAGRLDSSSSTLRLVRQAVPTAGTAVSSLATSADVLAIGTPTAVFRCPSQSLPLQPLRCDHQLISAVIDDVPTALSLLTQPPPPAAMDLPPVSSGAAAAATLQPAVFIGNNFSASIWQPDGQVQRVSGADGLPYSNVTLMLSDTTTATAEAADSLWVGHARGLSLYMPNGPGPSVQPELQPRGPWRYFHGDRYLPGERVVAIALPAVRETPFCAISH